MENGTTKVEINGNKIYISSDLCDVFSFLLDISKEVETLMKFEENLDLIRKGFDGLLQYTSAKLKEERKKNIQSSFNLSRSDFDNSIQALANFQTPIRSLMIILFSNIEVLYCFYLAYNNNTSDITQIINLASKNRQIETFINKYFLTKENSFYKNNESNLSKINALELRKLRNFLVHFFSTNTKILVFSNDKNKEALEMEKERRKTEDLISFISPEDLNELIKSAYLLLLQEWTADFRNDKEIFKDKIYLVKSLVKKYGSVKCFLKH